MMDSEKLRLRAEWYRHSLHDTKSMGVKELRIMVRSFQRVLTDVCKEETK